MSLAADVLVAVDNVEKHWDETSGLQALTMEVRARELVVVRGRSGTGKSTLLAMIAGWCPPDRGVVTWGPAFDGLRRHRVGPGRGRSRRSSRSWESCRRARTSRSHYEGAASAAPPRRERADEVLDVVAPRRAREASARRDVTRATPTHGARPRRSSVEPQAPARRTSPRVIRMRRALSRVVDVLRLRAEVGGGLLVTTHDEMVVAAADRVIDLDEIFG